MNFKKLVFTLTIGVTLFQPIAGQMIFENDLKEKAIYQRLESMHIAFTENHGQWSEKVLFKAEMIGASVYFCDNEVVYLFARDTDEIVDEIISSPPQQELFPRSSLFDKPGYKREALLIKTQFIGASQNPQLTGESLLPHKSNYFYGNNPDKWRTDVPNYSALLYKDIYPGIDLKYYGTGRDMKYDFIINPGADLSQICMKYVGVEDISVSKAGDLEAKTRFGLIYEKRPVFYQEIGGQRRNISGRFIMRGNGSFGFNIDQSYNPDHKLFVDPELVYSTYLGGSSYERGYGLAVDESGNIYLTGRTVSSDFPMENPFDSSLAGNSDAFVSMLSLTDNSLVFSTFLGGGGSDDGTDIAVDNNGNIYVTGYCHSSNFPIVDAYDGSFNGGSDVFVSVFSPAGNSLIYSTYLGGSSWDYAFSLEVDNLRDIYITGNTYSADFPTVDPFDNSKEGPYDAFFVILSLTQNDLLYSTYLGGDNGDTITDIAIDITGYAYVTGITNSLDFPTVNAYDDSYNGHIDAFVAVFSPTGNPVIYSTYLGGGSSDYGLGIAVGINQCAYITGYTSSSDFPTVNPYDGSRNGSSDAFVTMFSPAGSSLVYSTFIGGTHFDEGWGIAVDSSGYAYITGCTYSFNYPVVNPYDGSRDGHEDVILSIFSPSGESLIYSTYLGGGGTDIGYRIVFDDSENIYISGETSSSNFPMVNAYDESYNSRGDIFVVKFEPDILFNIPTLSEWGIIIFTLLLLACGTISITRRRWFSLSGSANKK